MISFIKESKAYSTRGPNLDVDLNRPEELLRGWEGICNGFNECLAPINHLIPANTHIKKLTLTHITKVGVVFYVSA